MVLAISSVLLVLAGISLFILQAWSLRQNYVRQIEASADLTSRNLAASVIAQDRSGAEQTLGSLRILPEINGAAILLNDGKRFATYADDRMLDSGLGQHASAQSIIKGSSLTLARPIEDQGKRLGMLFLSADFSAPYSELLLLYLGILLFVLAVSLVFAFFLSRWFHGFVSKPILKLAEVARKVADERDYSVRADSDGDDEVRVFTGAFNNMLARIQEQDGKLQKAQAELKEKLKSLHLEVTERVRAESEQRKLTAIIDNTPDFIGTIDSLGRILYLNAAARNMLGLGANSNIGSLRLSELHPPWAAKLVSTEGIPAAIHSGSWSGETAIRHTDGREVHVSEVIIAHKGSNGGLEQLSMVMRDFTERRRAEEALRLAELKFRGLVEQLPSVTYQTALGDSCSLSYVSPQVFPILGYTPEEWMESKELWAQQIHPDDKQVRSLAETTARETGKFSAEYRMFTKDGELRWLREQALFVSGNAEMPDSIFGSLIDITDTKLNDARLAELNTKLLETSRMAGMAEVATGVLHNVGNVLNSVNVSAGIVLNKLRQSKADKLTKAAGLLEANRQDLGTYLTVDPNGRKLPGYLAKLGSFLTTENSELLAEVDQLSHNIEHIKEVVAMQQSYAKVSGVFENLKPDDLVEDAL